MSDTIVSPIEFAREDLGLTLWRGQEDVLRAAAEVPRLAVVSGYKTGMTTVAAVLATWFYSTRPGARVVITSSNHLLVNDVINKVPEHVDGNRLDYYPPCTPDRFAGLSADTLVVVDNAEAIADETMMAIDVAAHAGARVVMFGHATTVRGTLWHEIFCGACGWRWSTIRRSSEDTPNAVSGEKKIPGLATRGWIEEKRREWGPDYASHPLYRSRVLGLFPVETDARA